MVLPITSAGRFCPLGPRGMVTPNYGRAGELREQPTGPERAATRVWAATGDLTATGVKPSATFKMMHYRKSLLPCGLWGIMSKAERASLDKYRDRDLHVSGGRLTRPLAMSSGRNGASSVEVLFSLQRRLRPHR
jgi:hypothetical protein